jgi:ferredoxin
VSTIRANRETCQGHGNCVLAFPGGFDLDDDGLVVLKRDRVEDGEVEAARRAAYDCPTDSITVDS